LNSQNIYIKYENFSPINVINSTDEFAGEKQVTKTVTTSENVIQAELNMQFIQNQQRHG